MEQDAASATFKGRGEADGVTTVAARLTLTRYNLRDRNPALQATDERIITHLKELHRVLRGELAA